MKPYEIVAGCPARHLGWRFDESIRLKLESLKWWDFPMNIIQENLELFDEIIYDNTIKKLESLKERIHDGK